jgi:hypothetical protein
MLHLHPAKRATFLEKLTRILRRKRKNIFQKKTSKKACQIKKELLLLHPLTERLARKKIRHVPRHIELTAVPIYRDRYKESKRIGRFKEYH